MRRLRWSIASWMAALLVVAAAACAENTDSGGGPSPQPTMVSPAATSAAGVTVTMSASAYAVGGTLKLTVHNGRSETVYTEDFQSQCTIVTLQKSSGGSWSDITGCGMGRPTRTMTLEPGASRAITLDPHGFHLAEGQSELAFGAGTYRIRFGYRLGAEPMGAQPLTAYSSNFTVR